MGDKWPGAGYNSVGSYQISGWPWLSSSIEHSTGSGGTVLDAAARHDITFPRVTNWLTIRNDSASFDLRFQFIPTRTGTVHNHQFGLLSPGESVTADWRTTLLSLSPNPPTNGQFSASVFAGLTQIPTDGALVFTGSNGIDWMGSLD